VAGIPCYDGDGPRLHVFYLYATGQPNDVDSRSAVIRDAVAQADSVFASSALRTGGVRHLRLRTGADCTLQITPLAVDKADPAANLAAIRKAGLLAAGDDALAFVGPTLGSYGGDATFTDDDTPGATNRNNAGGQIATIGFGFWGDVEAVPLVLSRALGAVQRSAPHASGSGHCTDGVDPLCFDDFTIGQPLTSTCPGEGRYLLDCGNDDYFSTAPAAGSWLATHWNVADSVFLASVPPARIDVVPPIGITVKGIPADGRVGPQTPITVEVADDQPLTQVTLASDHSPGLQPLTITGSSATGSLRSLESTGPGTLFVLVRDKLGRQRRSPVQQVTYVSGAKLEVGPPSAAISGLAPYTVTIDPSGDQLTTTRFVVFAPKTAEHEPIILVDRPYTPGTTTYTGTIDTYKLPDGDLQQLVLVLADSQGAAVPESQTGIRVTISNIRPALSFSVPSGPLGTTAQLTAQTSAPVTSVTYLHTRTDCASGRFLGSATTAPYAVDYAPAADWSGPQQPSYLCARAALADGKTTTVGPVKVTLTEPDSVELKLAPGAALSVGRNKLPVVLTLPSHRQVRLLQLMETSRLFGKGGHFVGSMQVESGAIPSTLDVDIPPGAIGSTELYVRAVFADSEGEFLRSNQVSVRGVAGPAPTITASSALIAAGEKVLLRGRASPGAQLRIYALSRPATTFRIVRSGAVPLDGVYGALLAPTTNTRFYVEVVGAGKSPQVGVQVRSLVSLSAARTSRLTYRLSGTVFPKRARVVVTVGARTSRGGVPLVRAVTTADGRWSATYRFPSAGTVEIFAVTTADLVNAAGSSAIRRMSVA
jgi:hypothetical protein